MIVDLENLSKRFYSMTVEEYEKALVNECLTFINSLNPKEIYLTVNENGIIFLGQFFVDEKNNIIFNGYLISPCDITFTNNYKCEFYTTKIIKIGQTYLDTCNGIMQDFQLLRENVLPLVVKLDAEKVRLLIRPMERSKPEFFIWCTDIIKTDFPKCTMGEMLAKVTTRYNDYQENKKKYINSKENYVGCIFAYKDKCDNEIGIYIPDNFVGDNEKGVNVVLDKNSGCIENILFNPYHMEVVAIRDTEQIEHINASVGKIKNKMCELHDDLINMFYYQK